MKHLVIGAGCFWTVEACYQRLGFLVEPGYFVIDEQDKIEAVKVYYQSHAEINLILLCFMTIHNPKLIIWNDANSPQMYRSMIGYQEEEQQKVIADFFEKTDFGNARILLEKENSFQNALDKDINYFFKNPNGAYCTSVISAKLKKVDSLKIDIEKSVF